MPRGRNALRKPPHSLTPFRPYVSGSQDVKKMSDFLLIILHLSEAVKMHAGSHAPHEVRALHCVSVCKWSHRFWSDLQFVQGFELFVERLQLGAPVFGCLQ